MPNWKNKKDYAFAKALDDVHWTWEFLRRNPEYKKDFAAAQSGQVKKGPSWLHYPTGGDEPIAWRLGRKWQIIGPIRDPLNNRPPVFVMQYPIDSDLEEISEFCGDPSEEDDTHDPQAGGPIPQPRRHVTLVFDLRRPMPPQIKRATKLLRTKQALVSLERPPHKGSDKWLLYLRILDAKDAGASNTEILETITAYSKLGNEAADGYAAAKAVSANLKAARLLRNRALTILR
jgi:hypothetical protein